MMHFDLFWLPGCLAAAWQLRQGRWWPAVLAWTAAFWLNTARRSPCRCSCRRLDSGLPVRRRIGRVAGGAAVVLAAASPPAGRSAAPPGLLGGGIRTGGWAANLLHVASQHILPGGAGHTNWIHAALGPAAVALLLAVRPKPDPRTHDGAAAWVVLALLAYLLLASPLFWPWYAVWPSCSANS